MRALIVEDEPVSAHLLEAMLAPYGATVVAANGMEAVDEYSSALDQGDYFDVILLDIMMPEVSGQEALAEIRAIEEERGIHGKSQVKVIMVTALDDSDNLYQAHACGCIDYLVKPIERERVMHALKRLGLCLGDA